MRRQLWVCGLEISLIFALLQGTARAEPLTAAAPNTRPQAAAVEPARVGSRKLTRPAAAESEPAAGKRTASRPASSWWTTLGGLAVVLVLILSSAFALKKHVPATAGILPAEVIQVLGRRYLDHRQSIQLVRCGSRILILANSQQHGLHTLAEVTDPVEVDLLAGLCQQSQANSVSQNFVQLFQKQFRPEPQSRRRDPERSGNRRPLGDISPEPRGEQLHA
jgi:flagellar biogenesis protein FliO